MTGDPLDSARLAPASALIARFATAFDADRLDADHLRHVSRALLDTVAVAIAGAREPAATLALAYGETLGGPPESRLWTQPGLRLTGAETAALCNGVATHVLDYDDVTSVFRGHASAALLPALLALGEAHDVSGRELAAAFAVGFEVICRMARVMVTDHYARGWHATSSIGTIGAAVACSRLLGLQEAGIVDAIGLAVSQAAGTRASFGTMAKSFQIGQCGAAAIRAARLAARGFKASPDALDGRYGFVDLYANGEDLVDGLEGLGGSDPLALIRSGFEITVTLRDGRLRRVETLRGSAVDPLSDAALAEKVNDCFAWGGGGDAQCFIDAASRLDELRVRQVLDAATRTR